MAVPSAIVSPAPHDRGQPPRGLLLAARLHVDERVEVLGARDAHELVGVGRVAVAAAHRAAAVGVDRPRERHARRVAAVDQRARLQLAILDAAALAQRLLAHARGQVRRGNAGLGSVMTFALYSPHGLAPVKSAPYNGKRASMPATASRRSAELLARHTREGELYEKLPDERVRCFACGHRCLIPPGQRRHLPGALQRGRHAARALRLRGRAAGRPGREEAVLPRAARRAGAVVRHARLRLPLRLLLRARDRGDARPGGRARWTRCSTAASRCSRPRPTPSVLRPEVDVRHPPRPRAARCGASSATTTAGR